MCCSAEEQEKAGCKKAKRVSSKEKAQLPLWEPFSRRGEFRNRSTSDERLENAERLRKLFNEKNSRLRVFARGKSLTPQVGKLLPLRTSLTIKAFDELHLVRAASTVSSAFYLISELVSCLISNEFNLCGSESRGFHPRTLLKFSFIQFTHMTTTSVKQIVIIGDGMVGKTCLLHSYSNESFLESYVPTVWVHIAVIFNLIYLAASVIVLGYHCERVAQSVSLMSRHSTRTRAALVFLQNSTCSFIRDSLIGKFSEMICHSVKLNYLRLTFPSQLW